MGNTQDGGTACSRKLIDVRDWASLIAVAAARLSVREGCYSTTTKLPYIPACLCPGTLQ